MKWKEEYSAGSSPRLSECVTPWRQRSLLEPVVWHKCRKQSCPSKADVSHVPVLISISEETEVSTKLLSVTKGFVFTSLEKTLKPLDNIAWHARKLLFLVFVCKVLLLGMLVLCSTIQIISWVTSMIIKSVRHYIKEGEFDPEQPVLKLYSLIMFFFPCMGVVQ